MCVSSSLSSSTARSSSSNDDIGNVARVAASSGSVASLIAFVVVVVVRLPPRARRRALPAVDASLTFTPPPPRVISNRARPSRARRPPVAACRAVDAGVVVVAIARVARARVDTVVARVVARVGTVVIVGPRPRSSNGARGRECGRTTDARAGPSARRSIRRRATRRFGIRGGGSRGCVRYVDMRVFYRILTYFMTIQLVTIRATAYLDDRALG